MTCRRIVAGLMLAALVLGSAGGCRELPLEGDDMQAAREAIAGRQWSQAERLLGRYLRECREPDKRWQAWQELLHVVASSGGDRRATLDYLEAMLEEFADDEAKTKEILQQIGDSCERLRRYDRAADAWTAYLSVSDLTPEESVTGHRHLSSMFFTLRRFEAAEEVLQQCLSLSAPDKLKIMCTYDLADQMLAHGRWDDAANLAQQILDTSPEQELQGLAGFVLGDALEQLGKTDEALVQFEQIRDMYPNPAVIDSRIAYLKKKQKKAR